MVIKAVDPEYTILNKCCIRYVDKNGNIMSTRHYTSHEPCGFIYVNNRHYFDSPPIDNKKDMIRAYIAVAQDKAVIKGIMTMTGELKQVNDVFIESGILYVTIPNDCSTFMDGNIY